MKRLLMLFVACSLAACAGGVRNVSKAEVYDFGLPLQHLVDGGNWANLALEVRAPVWIDSPSMEYRLLYEDPLKLRGYAGSRWAAAPGLLLAQRLRQQLGFVGPREQVAVNCLLRLDLEEFSQVFDTPQASRGILQGAASVLDARHRVVAERRIFIEQPAEGADARGGVRALVLASEELGRQLAGWLSELEKRGTLKSCRAGSGENR
ncbi:ABC-type transport auxiliary lipoprotein family protein [Accumulibacter sp.]|uniref:ABC-type transport auxiliary lipoprotein family protein n=1 Tax=Accumulibacter sp. TaxID=2053492 RepID=UPI0028C3AB60|nr:ABC-type transport auxiliary lipoprotein family protein [Accumulibacter sp.]